MKNRSLNSSIEFFLDLMKESFGCLAEIGESIFIKGIKLNDLFVAAHEIDFSYS